MTQITASSQAAAHRTRWKWFLALGVVLLILGIAGVSVASLLQLSFALVFGPLLLASSVVQLLTTFLSETKKEALLHFIAAGAEAVLGFLIMIHPPERVIGLAALVAVFLIVIGLARLARSLVTQSRDRAWATMAGVVALVLGLSVWFGGAVATLGFIGLCIGVDLLCHGASWSALALTERKSAQTSALGEPQ
jgi:uncharacterized membrane protein HdeD (DUF308 family)